MGRCEKFSAEGWNRSVTRTFLTWSHVADRDAALTGLGPPDGGSRRRFRRASRLLDDQPPTDTNGTASPGCPPAAPREHVSHPAENRIHRPTPRNMDCFPTTYFVSRHHDSW
ncbi:hypothetical protein AGIG_G6268 [Arapaima gigas]